MAKLAIKAGSTSTSVLVWIPDSASTTGGGKTGIAYNAGSFTAYYVRPGSTAAAITLATQTVTGAWSSGGWVEIDSTHMPGLYRLDVPDAVLATGVRAAVVMLTGAAGMAPTLLEFDLTNDSTPNLAVVLGSPRALDAVADAALTLNDAFHCAIAAAAGKESVVGTAYTIKTPSTGTTLRTFTLDSGSSPTSRS